LFEKLKPTTNTPDGVFQILAVAIEQNEIHEKETAEPARTERRKEVKSALNEDHFQRLEQKQNKTKHLQKEERTKRTMSHGQA
jgi:hypothetical protein